MAMIRVAKVAAVPVVRTTSRMTSFHWRTRSVEGARRSYRASSCSWQRGRGKVLVMTTAHSSQVDGDSDPGRGSGITAPLGNDQPWEARHSCDFRFVDWYRTQYSFTPLQAACVK